MEPFQIVKQIKFLNSDAAADATVESEECPNCYMYDGKHQAACTSHHDLSAMQPNPPAATNALPVPHFDPAVSAKTVSIAKGELQPGATYRRNSEGGYFYAPCGPVASDRFGVASSVGNIMRDDRTEEEQSEGFRRNVETMIVAAEKQNDLDAAMLRACRAALSKLREWPRCKDHDAPMEIRCCLPFSGNGKRYVFAGCAHDGCRATSGPVEVELSGPTARAIGDESWIAPEYRT